MDLETYALVKKQALNAVPGLVDDWLEENIDPASDYALDRTLTLENAAAPADLVGAQSAKIDVLDETLEGFYSEAMMEFTPTASYTDRQVYLSSGSVFLREETGYKVNEYRLKAKKEYIIRGSGQTSVSTRKTLYATVSIANKIPSPTGTFGTGKTYITYYNLTDNVEIVRFTPEVDCYIYVQCRSEYSSINLWGETEMKDVDILSNMLAHLKGKKIVNFGDSLFGNYRDPIGPNMSISAMIAELTGATVYNAGFGGCKMTKDGTTYWEDFSMEAIAIAVATNTWTDQDASLEGGSSTLPSYFSETITMLKAINWSEISIVTIGYGTNDFSGNVTEQDFKAALDSSIEALLTAYRHLKIYIISPMYRWWTQGDGSDTHENTNNDTLVDFVSWCKAEADKYHVGYADTYTNLGINMINRLQYFSSGDGTHPNYNGRYARAYKIVGVMQNE